jgi:hypothetical protein
MDDLLKNKFLWIVALVTFINVFVFVGGKLVVQKAADEVIERLQQDYSPSPYGPGFDPDKLHPNPEETQKFYYELKKLPEQDPVATTVLQSQQWREDWERERGFSPSQ